MVEALLSKLPTVMQEGIRKSRQPVMYIRGALTVPGCPKTTEVLIEVMRILNMSNITEGLAPKAAAKVAPKAAAKVAPKAAAKVAPKAAAKVAPKAAAKVAPKAASKGGVETVSITVLSETNPKRSGSASYDRFKLYTKHNTVEKFLAAGGTTADIRYDSEKGYIKLG